MIPAGTPCATRRPALSHMARYTRSAVAAIGLSLVCRPLYGQHVNATHVAPLPFDSLTVWSLLDSAFQSAHSAVSELAPALVGAVGRAQIAARDYVGAERTVQSLGETVPDAGVVAKTLGQSPWFVLADRAGLARQLSCSLHDAGRDADALAVVRRLPPGVTREWELAHEAAVTARRLPRAPSTALPLAPRVPLPLDSVLRVWRSSLSIAQEVGLPAARLDAFIAVAANVADSSFGRGIAQAAVDEARKVRLDDRDRQQSRDAMLAGIALRIGRTGEARALYAGLSDPQDLLEVVWSAARYRSAGSVVREFSARLVNAATAVRDQEARRAYLISVREALLQVGDTAFAIRLLGAPPRPSRHSARNDDLDSLRAASDDPRDRATVALERGDFAEVRRQVARIPSEDRRAERAALLSDLAWGTYMTHRDTATAYLALARRALLESKADSATFDERASLIVDRQFWIADEDGAITTLNLIRDPEEAEWAIHDLGGSSFSRLTGARVRALADDARAPSVRDAILARAVTNYLGVARATPADFSWAWALADSIATPRHRLQARVVLATRALERRDSTAARAALMSVLKDRALDAAAVPAEVMRDALPPLVRLGAWADIVAWASTSGEPAKRVHRLIAAATALQAALDERRPGGNMTVLSNGRDWCRNEF
jgi:hypothetical protein